MQQFIKIFKNVVFEGDEKNLAMRERAYFVRGYVKRPNENLSLLFQSTEHWAYVWHDKDEKEPHCHIIVRFRYNKTPTAFAKILLGIDNLQNWHFSALRDKYTAFDYLYHRDEKSIAENKTRYNDGDVLTDDIAYFTRGGQSSRDNLAFYNDLIENNLSHIEMARKYGRDYLKNIARYDEAKKTILDELKPKTDDKECYFPAEYATPLFLENLCYFLLTELKQRGLRVNIDPLEIDTVIQNLTKNYI